MPKAKKQVYAHPSVRNYSDEYTPAKIRIAQRLADAGNLAQAADLCEQLLVDDRIGGTLGTRVRGLLGLELTFQGEGDGRSKGRVAKALEQDWWGFFPEDALVELVQWGLLFGVGLGQLAWTNQNGRLIPKLTTWHPRFLRYDWDKRVWKVQTEGGSEIEITPGDGQWVLYTPYGALRPWSRGLWRSMAKWWLLKHYGVADWGRSSEVHGAPTRVITGPERGDPDQLDQAVLDFGDLGSDTAVGLPHGYTAELLEAEAEGYKGFEAQIAAADKAFTIAVFGQNLTTDVEGGSFAAAKVHGNVRQDLIEFDAEQLSTSLHDQAVVPYTTYNFGNAALAPWPEWDTQPPADQGAEATTLSALAKALGPLVAAGADARKLLEHFGVPLVPKGQEPKPAKEPPKDDPDPDDEDDEERDGGEADDA